MLNIEPLADKWKSFGFAVKEINGHDVTAIKSFFTSSLPLNNQKPTALICHTIKGKGFSFAENNPTWHHKSNLSDADIKKMYENI